MEKTLVKVLKGLAEYLDMSLGDLLEGDDPARVWKGKRRSHRKRWRKSSA